MTTFIYSFLIYWIGFWQNTLQSPDIHGGDIIFQTSLSAQSQAIQAATHSIYSHIGILYFHKNEWFVYEAVATVRLTPLKTWIQRGKNGHYVIKRLKNKTLTSNELASMKQQGEQYQNKPYDLYFGWQDDKIYCSELVWKIYKNALQIELGNLQKLREFDLKSPLVQQKLKERYGKTIPTEEPVISPAAIFESEQLETIFKN